MDCILSTNINEDASFKLKSDLFKMISNNKKWVRRYISFGLHFNTLNITITFLPPCLPMRGENTCGRLGAYLTLFYDCAWKLFPVSVIASYLQSLLNISTQCRFHRSNQTTALSTMPSLATWSVPQPLSLASLSGTSISIPRVPSDSHFTLNNGKTYDHLRLFLNS